MEELVKLMVDNGLSVICVAFLMYYLLINQKETVKTLNEISKTLVAICTILGVKQEDIDKIKREII